MIGEGDVAGHNGGVSVPQFRNITGEGEDAYKEDRERHEKAGDVLEEEWVAQEGL